MANEKRLVQQIIRKYGDTINLRERPDILIEILRRFHIAGDGDGPEGPDGGTPPGPPDAPEEPPPGGLRPAPAPPPPTGPSPGPSEFPGRPTIDDVMREVLKISRAVAKINEQIRGTQRKK